jgi:RNA polymerase subunit RPABC4/transcription elongation factor Spt4
MYCKNCGQPIETGSNFCPTCGTRQAVKPELDTDIITHQNDSNSNKSSNVSFPLKRTDLVNNKNIRLPRREREAMSFGIFIYIICFIISILISTGTIVLDQSSYGTLVVLGLLLRIMVTFWINSISKRLKRNQLSWCIFAFFIPLLALIIIGNLTYNKTTIRQLKENQI